MDLAMRPNKSVGADLLSATFIEVVFGRHNGRVDLIEKRINSIFTQLSIPFIQILLIWIKIPLLVTC
jgi:hypothetical protein